jgi:hypothetical protein
MPSKQFSRRGIGPLRIMPGFGKHSWQSLGSLPSVFSSDWDMFLQESYGDYRRRINDRRLGISDTMIEAVEGMASFLFRRDFHRNGRGTQLRIECHGY